MICPRDQQVLQESSNEGFHLHFCPKCHGVYVRLNQSSSPGITNCIIKPDQRPKITVPEDEQAISPISGKPMLVLKHKGVIIDYCPDSNSVWLDSGELEKISAGTPGEKAAKQKKMKHLDTTAAEDVGDVVGVVLEVAAEAVGAIFTSC